MGNIPIFQKIIKLFGKKKNIYNVGFLVCREKGSEKGHGKTGTQLLGKTREPGKKR